MPPQICPRDATPLTPQKDVLGAGTQALTCAKCAGVMVDWKTGQQFFTSLGLSLQDLHAMVGHASQRPRKGEPVACTACGKSEMKPLVYKGIELDLCAECGTSWFDRGELSRITGGKLGQNVKQTAQPVAGERGQVVGVYEMFWDCGYCDAKALLGKSHRFCPSCGARQDAAWRYLPPAGKEVAANTEYDGADKACPACDTPNGAKAHNCRGCGSPLDGAAEVGRVADRSSDAPRAAMPGQPSKPAEVGRAADRSSAAMPGQPSKPARGRGWIKYAIGAVVLSCLGFGVVAALLKKDVNVTVTGHAWTREINIESRQATSDSSWCDSLPSDAYDASRRREKRSTKQVADGEECSTRDVDRGDGTFERRRECRPKYRSEPVYDDKCYYTVDRWRVARTAKIQGAGTSPAPRWPTLNLSRTGNCLGCEREGSRRATYLLKLKGADAKKYECEVPDSQWSRVADGLAKPIKVRVLTGTPDCDQL